MNCVERVRRENAMLAPFLDGVKAYTDEQNGVIFQFSNEWARDMFTAPEKRALLARALSAEMKRPVDPQTLIFEVPSASTTTQDTILDDLLEAAEQQ